MFVGGVDSRVRIAPALELDRGFDGCVKDVRSCSRGLNGCETVKIYLAFSSSSTEERKILCMTSWIKRVSGHVRISCARAECLAKTEPRVATRPEVETSSRAHAHQGTVENVVRLRRTHARAIRAKIMPFARLMATRLSATALSATLALAVEIVRTLFFISCGHNIVHIVSNAYL